jgi:hypothetical protein
MFGSVGHEGDAQQPADACNQTVMSGGKWTGSLTFVRFLFDFDRVRCSSVLSFLVRNWCGQRIGRASRD